jgi:hypothetical protein
VVQSAALSTSCTGDQLDMAVGAAAVGPAGREGVTILVGDHSNSACQLGGAVEVQVLGGGGAPLSASGGSAPGGQAWLVPDRMALDPWEPQPGEATLQVSWLTGGGSDCPGVADSAAAIGLTPAGGASVTSTIDTLPAFPQGMAACGGAVRVGPITPVSSAQSFPGSAEQAADFAVQRETGAQISSTCAPESGTACLTRAGSTLGAVAAYFDYQMYTSGGGALCYAYVYRDTAGWHPLDVLCNGGSAPANGSTVTIAFPGGGCAGVRSAPGHAARAIGCVSSGPQASYYVVGAPVYVAETDPATGLPMGTLWWYLSGLDGWVAQDWITGPQP